MTTSIFAGFANSTEIEQVSLTEDGDNLLTEDLEELVSIQSEDSK